MAAQIRSSNHIVLFLDFDGTLVDIAPRPDQVCLKPSAQQILKRLARHPRLTLVVISGRPRRELVHYIGLRDIHYYGLFGWERTDRCPFPRSSLRALQGARKKLTAYLSTIHGTWIEDKRFILSVHLPGVAPVQQRRARRKIRSLLQPFRKAIQAIETLRDMEIVPRCIPGKGSAVKEFLAQSAPGGALAVYLGDDLSDESAFQVIKKGITVRVGTPRPTYARYSLPDPAAAAIALAKIEAALI